MAVGVQSETFRNLSPVVGGWGRGRGVGTRTGGGGQGRGRSHALYAVIPRSLTTRRREDADLLEEGQGEGYIWVCYCCLVDQQYAIPHMKCVGHIVTSSHTRVFTV